ncbi:MAG: MFS transporter [Prevotella sp.]|nr:MFS transporter [Prevotella sp.]
MDTQNTPVHIKLWNHSFWHLALANMFLTSAMTAFIPIFAMWFLQRFGSDKEVLVGYCMLAMALGMPLLCGFNSWLIQRYRRNKVCLTTIALQLATLLVMYEVGVCLPEGILPIDHEVALICLAALLGAFYGLAQVILSCTLIIDVCESNQRTEANYAASWFRRFGFVIGPVAAILMYGHFGPLGAIGTSAAATIIAFLLISSVRFPFRTPDDDVPLYTLDRFFMPQSWPMVFNLMLIIVTFGIVLSHATGLGFYLFLALGFVIAILAERFAFPDAELKSEVVTGLIVIMAASLIEVAHPQENVHHLVPTLLGFGYGLICTRFQLFFIKLAKHCKRSSAQSSFVLAVAMGTCVGLYCAYTWLPDAYESTFLAVLLLSLFSLLMYNFIIHPWYVKHKNR